MMSMIEFNWRAATAAWRNTAKPERRRTQEKRINQYRETFILRTSKLVAQASSNFEQLICHSAIQKWTTSVHFDALSVIHKEEQITLWLPVSLRQQSCSKPCAHFDPDVSLQSIAVATSTRPCLAFISHRSAYEQERRAASNLHSQRSATSIGEHVCKLQLIKSHVGT